MLPWGKREIHFVTVHCTPGKKNWREGSAEGWKGDDTTLYCVFQVVFYLFVYYKCRMYRFLSYIINVTTEVIEGFCVLEHIKEGFDIQKHIFQTLKDPKWNSSTILTNVPKFIYG